MDDDNKDAQIAALNRQIAIEGTVHETGVPAELLANATDADDMARIAAEALAWRAAAAPSRPPTAAVPVSTVTSADRIAMAAGQVTTRDQLAQVSPAERMRAWREGRLTQIGVGQPPPRSTPMDRR